MIEIAGVGPKTTVPVKIHAHASKRWSSCGTASSIYGTLYPSTRSCLTLPLRNSLPSSFSSTRCAYSTASTREKRVSIDTYLRPVNVCSWLCRQRHALFVEPRVRGQG